MNIKELRNKTGLTQREFGERLGVQSQTILKYEKEERKIPDTVKKLIRYEFAKFLSEEDLLLAKFKETDTFEKFKKEQERLKAALREKLSEQTEIIMDYAEKIDDLENDKADLKRDKEMLQLHIETLTGKKGGNQQTA